MMRGIAMVKPGATTGDIGHAIQAFAEAQEKMRGGAGLLAAMAWAGSSFPAAQPSSITAEARVAA